MKNLIVGDTPLAAGLQLSKRSQTFGLVNHDQTFKQKSDFVALKLFEND